MAQHSQKAYLRGNRISAGDNINISTAGRDVIVINEVSRLNDRGQERRDVLSWISGVNFKAIQKDTYSKVAAGTGLWFLKSDVFLQWMKMETSVFWGVGMAGAGKTYLSSVIINELQRRSERETDLTVVFAYCRFEEGYTDFHILSALLRQLAENSDVVYESICKPLYATRLRDDLAPSPDDILLAITDALGHFSKTIIVIDALDELTDIVRNDLVSILQSLPALVMLTSRPIGLLDDMKPNFVMKAQKEDLKTFIRSKLVRLPSLRGSLRTREKVVLDVVDMIEQKSRGMFLLARLQVDALKGIMTINKLVDAIKTLPSTISEMYTATLQRINEQTEEERAFAHRAITWVTHACRPLKVQELRSALACYPGCKSIELDDLIHEQTILSICYGLTTIEEENDTARLSHYTAHQFLIPRVEAPFLTAHEYIAESCASYLSIYTSGGKRWPQDTEHHQKLHSKCHLWSYSNANLGYHLHKAVKQHMLCILPSNSRSLLEKSTYLPLQTTEHGYRWCDYGTGAHFAAKHGILPAFHTLSHSLDQETKLGATPLMLAAGNGHLAVVRHLLEERGVDVNQTSTSVFSQAALGRACVLGHKDVVQLLLEQSNIDVTVGYRGIPILHAMIQYGSPESDSQLEIFKLLLRHRPDSVSTRDSILGTVLHYAAEFGTDPAILELFLKNSTLEVIQQRDQVNGQTAYAIAKRKKRTGLYQVFEKYGAQDLATSESNGDSIPGKVMVVESSRPHTSRTVPHQAGTFDSNDASVFRVSQTMMPVLHKHKKLRKLREIEIPRGSVE